MDGMHDLGGRQGFGRGPLLARRAQAFHEPWEKRVNALYSLAVKLGIFNMDEYRHAIERMEPRHYLSASYYERSLTSLATLCVEKGIVTREELERRAQGAFPLVGAERAGPHQRGGARALQARRSRAGARPTTFPAMCACRATSAARPASSSSESPAYPFPDAHAHGVEAADEPTYDVRFSTEELWPNSADPAFVHVGVFQSYLERVTETRPSARRSPALYRFPFFDGCDVVDEKACVFLRGVPSIQAKTRHCRRCRRPASSRT